MPRIWILIAVTTMMLFIVSARMAPPLSIGPDATIKADEVAVPDRLQNSGLVEALTTVRVASGLNLPIFVTYAPGDSTRLFIVEQRGVIKILDLASGIVLATPFLDIDALVAFAGGNDERGLLGLAFHPNYQVNGFFYVNYINNSSNTIIGRYTVTGDPNIADSGSALQVLFIDQPFSNHNGGWLGFGPNDGYLYIATGDGGLACDPAQRAQDITNQLLGKILRIDVDGGSPYAIPADNPFDGVTGDEEIWAYGLRNPWRNSFDRATGDLYIADVGQRAREEIDYQLASSTGGENYGWDCREGTQCANTVSSQCSGTTNGCICASVTSVDPIHEYDRSLGFSITGGYVYRGCAIPSLQGTYFFGDFGSSRIWSFTFDGVNKTNFTERTTELSPSSDGFFIGSIASFGEDANGEVYIVDRGGTTTTGEIFKIIPEVLTDTNGNGIPDGCDLLACPSDFDLSGEVNVTDLLALLGSWGPCAGCLTDSNGDGNVNVTDLLALLAAWGLCS
ncbi:MAG: PQQ-dependent sugar dehydrogenase [Planctomycetes bacterium]|nr:PQQ-dependent sugar dehydrogenase [Planctomycetota bacterium]